MRCDEVIARLEELSPARYAQEWDNVGLLAGRGDKEIGRVMLALDATSDVIEQAYLAKADLLLTHHPLIFSPLKRISGQDFIGKRLTKLIKNDICYFAMHTNFDVMGMADAAADELELRDRSVLKVTCEDDISKEGIGRVGRLPRIMTLGECAQYVKRAFRLPQVCVYGQAERSVEKIAVLPGSGKEEIADALASGADVYLTGDITHHEGIDALEQGLALIDAGHFGLEQIFMPYMKAYFEREMPEIEVMRAVQNAPFSIM